ncbi:MAG: hypothetical protein JXA54_08340 [Candidatus Heimdallarchaeota archaeon]|nr:hypothetical protein [Candidatus Heimdallarchaeota archaeon]
MSQKHYKVNCQPNSMKRLTSIDFARGLAVFGMTIFHAFFNNWDFFALGLGSLKWWGYPFALIFFILGHWRGFFIMVSAVVHMYSMGQSYKKGTAPGRIFVKQFVTGGILWGFGALYNAFFNTWGIIDTWHRSGSWNWSVARDFTYFTEALQNIALGIIIASIIFFIIAKLDLFKYIKRNLIIIASFALVIIMVSPAIQLGLTNFFGTDVTQLNPYDTSLTGRNPFVQYLLIQIGGRESPIFPMLSSSLIGAGIGLWLLEDKPSRQMFKIGYWTSLGLFLFGGVYFGLVDVLILKKPIFDVLLFSHVHPTWFALANTGLELAALLFIIQKVEFNSKLKLEKWLFRSRWFRRWGVMALTVFVFQVMVFLPEKLISVISGIGDPLAFSRYQLSFGWSVLVAIFFFLMMEGIIRLWDLGRFIGTFEWFFLYTNYFTSGKKINHKDPIRSREIIYDVEPVMFVEPQEENVVKKINDNATS